MIDHLKHMATVRPAGLDKDTARWAITEIERLQTALKEMLETLGRGGDASDIVAAAIAIEALRGQA